MIFKLTRLSNDNLRILITIPWKRVKTAYNLALKSFTKKTEIKGFRKGKAPLKLVEEKIGKNVLYEEVIKSLIPKVYTQAIKRYHLHPITLPKFKLIQAQEEKNWQIEAITCEAPKVKLGNYKEEIKKTKAVEKIWIPGKEKKEKKISQKEELEKIFEILLATCSVKLPPLLIEEEVNRMLARLIDQLTKLGLTIEEYLISLKKTKEELKEEYQKEAEKLLKLEFILLAIADQEKIQVEEKEIEGIIKAIPQKEIQKEFQTPEQKLYLQNLLIKQKVIDSLRLLS